MSAFRCTNPKFKDEKFQNDGVETTTSKDQKAVEESVSNAYKFFNTRKEVDPDAPLLLRDEHVTFLKKGLTHLSESYQCLDASRPWICYWILNSLMLLEEEIPDSLKSFVVGFLSRCQNADGGFGGGPGQFSHLAPTYAAINALCTIGTEEAYASINRKELQEFLQRMKSSDGSFIMHEGGEADVRGAYCALSVARLTNIYTPELFDNTAQYIVRCQTYEGGFSGAPGMEAHGGYSFCGFAALVLLGKSNLCDITSLVRWAVNRQMRYEGGFQGRTNKLVDSCYSFWQGGIFPLIHKVLLQENIETMDVESWLCNQQALQEYVLICCQSVLGGLIDKPGKPRDFYHTCYSLSGLSIAQHCNVGNVSNLYVVGASDNELNVIHPVHNISVKSAASAYSYFNSLSLP